MKKVIVVLCLCFISFVNAEDDMFIFHEDEVKKGWYLGVGKINGSGVNDFFGYRTDSVDIDVSGNVIKVAYDSFFYKLEFAYSNNTISSKSVSNSQIHGIDIDYIFVYPRYKLKPFVSIGLGTHYWRNYSFVNIQGNENLEGGSYSFSGGLTYEIDKFELEIAYKYKLFKWEAIDITTSGLNLDQETEVKMINLGINYKF